MPTGKIERFSWNFTHSLVEDLEGLINRDTCERYFFGGSYVRHQDTCGDIDVALCNPIPDLFNTIQLSYPGARILTKGKTINRFVLPWKGHEVQLDTWSGGMDGWGPLCMFVAGSGKLNANQRFNAKRQGYVLGFDLKRDGQVIPMHSEAETYDHMGWKWLPYPLRSLG